MVSSGYIKLISLLAEWTVLKLYERMNTITIWLYITFGLYYYAVATDHGKTARKTAIAL